MKERIVGWRTPTRQGMAAIMLYGGRWQAMLGEESLGSYHSPEAALDDMLGGHTFTPSCGVSAYDLGLPDELAEWEPVITR